MAFTSSQWDLLFLSGLLLSCNVTSQEIVLELSNDKFAVARQYSEWPRELTDMADYAPKSYN